MSVAMQQIQHVPAPSRPAQLPGAGQAAFHEVIRFGTGRVTTSVVEAADPVVLMAAVALLSARDVECLDEAEAEAFVVACERVAAALHARQSLAMDTLAGRVDERLERGRAERPLPSGVPHPQAHSIVASMLAPALHCSTRTVRRRLETDRWLVCTAESTFAAHWQGELERFRADVIVDVGVHVDPELRATFEALVLETSVDEVTGELTLISPRVRQLSRSELSRRATAIARELDPDSHDRAAQRGRRERRMVVTPDRRRPGMARWLVLLPSEVSHEVFSAVDALAGQYARANPETPVDAHRVDALADLVLGNAQVTTTVELVVPVLATTDAELSPVSATIIGTVHHPALGLGLERQPQCTTAFRWLIPGPVEVPRHGELLPRVIADLLSRPDTMVRLARLDPDGSIVQDPRAYRPGRALRRRLRARDGTCRFPGCQTPAARCDIDHVVPHPLGPTEPGNLICLCRTHHRFKHHGGWRAVVQVDGRVTWTAPDGRVYTTRPTPLRILEELRLTEDLDAQLVHDLARGWYPGLPRGMSLAALVLAEASLPDEPPEAIDVPAPPGDWRELDDLAPRGTDEAAPTWDEAVGDDLEDLSPLERTLAARLALAA